MIVVRYTTLAALVLWLGAMLGARYGDLSRLFPPLTLVCGAIVFVGLFAMKFMGPPPSGFMPRVALVFLMLIVAGASAWLGAGTALTWLPMVNIGVGFVLLYWYARE
jgi:hypothetical protein